MYSLRDCLLGAVWLLITTRLLCGLIDIVAPLTDTPRCPPWNHTSDLSNISKSFAWQCALNKSSSAGKLMDTERCLCLPTKSDLEDPPGTTVWRCSTADNITESSSTEFLFDERPCRVCTPLDHGVHSFINAQLYNCTIDHELESNSSTVFEEVSNLSSKLKQNKLNVVVFSPLPDKVFNPAFDLGHSIYPAAQLAAEHINRRADILPKHYFNLIKKDSGCDKIPKTAIETIRVVRDLLVTRHGPIAIIGPACSEDSIFVANTFRRIFNLPVFYSGTTPYLSEHADDTPNAFGVISSTSLLTDMLIRIAAEENWNWKNVAVLYEDSREYFQHAYSTFVRGLNNSQQVGYTRQIAESHIPLAEIIERNIRIVVVFSGEESARHLICVAGQKAFVFPIRQFIFIGSSLEDFLGVAKFSFTEQGESKMYYCDNETMMKGLNGSVFLNQGLDSVDPKVVTVSNYTVGEIKEQYKRTLNLTWPETSYAYPYYDAMWALALGMHTAFSSDHISSFDDVHNAILNHVSFQGVSSWIDFSSSQDRHVTNAVSVVQTSGSHEIVRALLQSGNLSYPSSVFIDDEIETEDIVLHISLTVIGIVSSFLCLVLTVVLHVLNVFYRDYPSVKAGSQRLNHFIFFGCYLLVLAIISYTVLNRKPETAGLLLCNTDIFCSIVGYCFIISTVIAKSWRTHCIFNLPFKSQRFLDDRYLAFFIMLLVFLTVLLFIPFLVISPLMKKQTSSFAYVSRRLPVKKVTTTCASKSHGYITIPLTFQVLLSVGTMFLATLNRTVKQSNFRTTKQIFVFVYMLTVTWAVGGTLLLIFNRLGFSNDGIYFLYILLLVITVVLSLTSLIMSAFMPVMKVKK